MDTWHGARARSEAGMLARIHLSVSRLVDGLGGPALSNAALPIEGDRITRRAAVPDGSRSGSPRHTRTPRSRRRQAATVATDSQSAVPRAHRRSCSFWL